ncbi:MAG: hypothetical protein WAV04_01870 [Candidatus Microsaccharimonas sp.]
MSIYNYLQLQPVDPQDDGTVSDLDEYAQDETIDLTQDIDEQTLDEAWNRITEDFKSDPEKLNFSDK